MSSIFPLRDTITQDESREPRLVDLDEETADEVFEALAATTTRKIFLSLHEQPQTASDLAKKTETSVQNVQYHLTKLRDAELVDVVDTWYSERGSEMKVYAPNDESLVLYAGRDKKDSLRSVLNRLVGISSVLVPTSILAGLAARYSMSSDDTQTVESLAEDGNPVDVESVDLSEDAVEAEDTEAGDDLGIASTEQTEEPEHSLDAADFDGSEVFVTENQTEGPVLITDGGNATTLSSEPVNGAPETILGLDPAIAVGLAFFLGGLVVLISLWAWFGWPGESS